MELEAALALGALPCRFGRAVAHYLHETARSGGASADPIATILSGAGLNGEDAGRLERIARARASTALDASRHLGLVPVVWGGAGYPATLAEIADPPPVLWIRGDAAVLTTTAVAIVGSRAGTPYAREVAHRLAADLAACGVTVVSGLARGVDAAAHEGALAAPEGRTVAVLGSGADVVYPPEHTGLAAAIANRGAIVTELPAGSPPRKSHFPRRNRIISGLARAIVIVEASARSGSLITARLALEQGREVMAVPGNVLTGRNRGAHALIRDGAKLVEDAADVLEELQPFDVAPATAQPDAEGAGVGLDRSMRAGEAYSLDDLVALTGRAPDALLPELLRLELDGRVTRVAGGRFVRRTGKVVT